MTRAYRTADTIRSLADIRARCWVDEDTGCWNWRLAVAAIDGQPRASFTTPERKYQTTAARIVWMLKLKRELKPAEIVYRRCLNPNCVSPRHLKMGTKAEAGACLRKAGYLRGDPVRTALNTRLVRENIAKLSMEQAREIRASGADKHELAKKHGVKPKTILDVLAHRCWRENSNGSSVFNWK